MTRRTPPANGLSPDDEQLWDIMRARIEPLRKQQDRIGTAASSAGPPPSPAASPTVQRPLPGARANRSVVGDQRPKPVVERPPAPRGPVPPLQPLDLRKSRRIASGRTAIDARIDLHGLYQSEAHATLRRFLLDAHGRGFKFVKVITGKGATVATAGESRSYFEADNDRGRGVLRRMVPQWLAAPELRAIVVGVSPAGRGHGGDGALIVELRKGGRL